ncbi:MAG: hypothetical protein ACI8RZ_002099, partial [Myxococcota bacterium]
SPISAFDSADLSCSPSGLLSQGRSQPGALSARGALSQGRSQPGALSASWLSIPKGPPSPMARGTPSSAPCFFWPLRPNAGLTARLWRCAQGGCTNTRSATAFAFGSLRSPLPCDPHPDTRSLSLNGPSCASMSAQVRPESSWYTPPQRTSESQSPETSRPYSSTETHASHPLQSPTRY